MSLANTHLRRSAVMLARRHLSMRPAQAVFALARPVSKPVLRAGLTSVAVRGLHLHEYQSQDLLRKAGINIPVGQVARTVPEAVEIAERLFASGVADLVVKAQVLAGGRGLGTFTSGFKGGVHVCHQVEDVGKAAQAMLGSHLVTKQTGAKGVLCQAILITERMYSRRELYIAFVMDRTAQGIALVASTKGGVNIEKVAEEDPNAIIKVSIDSLVGLTEPQALEVAHKLEFTKNAPEVAKQLVSMYNFFTKNDCTQLEINPFIETPQGKVYCLDAKLNFDPNAEFRHKEIFALNDTSNDDPREVAARKYDLNYIGLDGNVGCLVNGAGLAMATMDVIKLKDGNPANFLDVGGGASEEQVYEALKIMAEDQRVKAVLVNIFGGIMRCDVIASGVISAVKRLNMRKPIIVRLKGTNDEVGKSLIRKSGLSVISAEDLNDAARKAVHIANIAHLAETININVSFD
eukprot:c32760_g1_i1.p1 GENE.c32760_g1_i1~~c32760_g1_i1.p1  ORF type:complete len:474 (+),score=115.27 c32760_g1_i1:39-1424(+)